jgi:hypothetical protein
MPKEDHADGKYKEELSHVNYDFCNHSYIKICFFKYSKEVHKPHPHSY